MDSDDDLLAQLQATAAPEATDADVLDMLNVEPEPDPLADVDYTGDIAEDSAREFTALEQGFRDRAQRENDRFRMATDSEYWVAVCFKSREDKERFLNRAGLLRVGDKYLDGYQVARILGIDVSEGGE